MGRNRGFDETTVLDVVRDRFWTTGFDGTSTYDLMEVDRPGQGQHYKAFGNKHALYARVFSDYCQGLVAQAREELRAGPHAVLTSPMARLERYVVSLADAFATESPRRGCFLSKVTADRAGEDDMVAGTARRAFEDLAGALASAIRDAQDAGEVAEHADATALHPVMPVCATSSAELREAMSRLLAGEPLHTDSALSQENLAREAQVTFLRGWTAHSWLHGRAGCPLIHIHCG
ncbi:TetR/AcrR family transcriptional regulator [Streptomyces sp. AC555_RSS877]|uniref:TetR/AcrR family transcriptional regulator n=1 Tax=Streptomyces sp. AC555_RSS877 TaxID=2823688 RepID=UPI001C25FFAC|nr:TetR/AcrR family transcriptional regulator [Streptomyces sp. AC555_RSS877]